MISVFIIFFEVFFYSPCKEVDGLTDQEDFSSQFDSVNVFNILPVVDDLSALRGIVPFISLSRVLLPQPLGPCMKVVFPVDIFMLGYLMID